jgi:hypothetical protein
MISGACGVSRRVGEAVGVVWAKELDMAPQYLPPVFVGPEYISPQIIISLPVQTAVWEYRPVGAWVVLVAVQVSVPGSYLPPVLK